MKCQVCGTESNVDSFAASIPADEGSATVKLNLCRGRSKAKIGATSCAGLVTDGSIFIREWTPSTAMFRLSDRAAKAVNARGGGRQQGLGYFIPTERGSDA